MRSGVTGNWSVRDILAHVTTWEEEALNHLPRILKGGSPPRYSTKYGGIDAFNALMTEQKKHLSLSDVLRQMDVTHRRLVNYIEGIPEHEFREETRFRHVCGSIPMVTIQYTRALSGNGLKSRASELQNSFDPYLIQDEYLTAQQIELVLMTF